MQLAEQNALSAFLSESAPALPCASAIFALAWCFRSLASPEQRREAAFLV